MRKGSKTYAAYNLAPLALVLMATLVAGCGKKEKKNESVTVAAPDTWVTDSSIDGTSAKIKYKSSDANAKFKCQLEAEGQKDAAWSDCAAEGTTLTVEPGVRYIFRVKAVGASGAEDQEPYTYSFVGGPKADGTAGSGPATAPTTLILNKEDVGETYANPELALELGVAGGPTVDDVRFECKRENETSFRRCPDGATYAFAAMKDGYVYSLAVRAVLRDGGTNLAEDRITFRVALAGLTIGGRDKLAAQTSGPVAMTYPAGARCAMDSQAAVPCVPTFAQIDLSNTQVPTGNHTLIVTMDGGGKEELSFCARTCAGSGVRPAPPIVSDFQLGSFYTYHIPEGMHVVNYATSKTGGNGVYWLRATEDPLSNDLDACLNDALPFPVPGREFSMLTPAGQPMKYCATTPNRQVYKEKTENRRA